MKVPYSIRNIYEQQLVRNEHLKEIVDERIKSNTSPRWHFESRIKALESFALKIETGRVHSPHLLEDFYACTIVVINNLDLDKAKAIISQLFTIKEERPATPYITHKSPDSFPFDDLRVYASLKDMGGASPREVALSDLIFEIQIKTYLQHAWAIATHDLVYKSPTIDWAKSRIAYQIKAMLEHAELSIQESQTLAQSTQISKTTEKIIEINKVINFISSEWLPEERPKNIKLLAENILSLIKSAKIDFDRLVEITSQQKAARNNQHPKNLSPYAALTQYLLTSEEQKMKRYMTSDSKKFKILIPAEIDTPQGIKEKTMSNAIFL